MLKTQFYSYIVIKIVSLIMVFTKMIEKKMVP